MHVLFLIPDLQYESMIFIHYFVSVRSKKFLLCLHLLKKPQTQKQKIFSWLHFYVEMRYFFSYQVTLSFFLGSSGASAIGIKYHILSMFIEHLNPVKIFLREI